MERIPGNFNFYYRLSYESPIKRKRSRHVKMGIFKSCEMPHGRDDTCSFLRGAFKEMIDYEYEKQMNQEQSADVEQSHQASIGW